MKENADKPSLKYMDSVLRRWKKEGLTTPAQVQEQQQSFTAAKAKKSRRPPARQTLLRPGANQERHHEQYGY